MLNERSPLVTISYWYILMYQSFVYMIQNDPLEKNDIAKIKKGKEIVAKLFPKLLKLQNKCDKLDLTKSFPNLAQK